MFYSFPKKIQLQASLAKWALSSTDSVLLILGLDELQQDQNFEHSELNQHLTSLVKKAKTLEIPIVSLNTNELMNGMMFLGEQVSLRKQLIVTGKITAQAKQLIEYLGSVTENICVINDAILLSNIEQHIQWIESISQQKYHHTNTYSLLRLWTLSAPKEFILSSKGILLSIAEALDIEALEIDPTIDLKNYGLDSVSIVSLVGLWRANGANIQYEDFTKYPTLEKLLAYLVNRQ